MQNRLKIRSAACLAGLILFATAAPPRAASAEPPLVGALKQSVEKTLAQAPGYRALDVLSRSQAEAVLRNWQGGKLNAAQTNELLKRVPSDDEFLVRALSTPKGAAFMRQVAAMPQGYDRLDRLSRIPNGQQVVQQLIDIPDGHKLIEYMTGTSGGKELGTMLGQPTNSDDFNRATGRIYTAKQLQAELEKLTTAGRK
jgi:hypothetical protein